MSSLASDEEGRAEQDETNWISTDIQGVPISWKCRAGKVYCKTGCCQNCSQNIGMQLKLSRYAEEKVYSAYADLRSRAEASQVSIGEDMRAVSRNTELLSF